MTLGELRKAIDRDDWSDDMELVVSAVCPPGIISMDGYFVPVKNIQQGMDWTQFKLFIIPSEKLIEKNRC